MHLGRANRKQRCTQRLFAFAVVVLLAWTSVSSAAWLGYKNETRAAVVVQTTIVVNNNIVRGKAHVLYPGEIAWDNIPAPGARQISIYDPKANNKLVHQDTVTILNQDIFLGVRIDTPAQQPGKPAPQPQMKLVATKAPVAPGVVPQQPAQPNAPKTPTGPAPAAPVKPNTPPPAPPANKSGN